MSDKLSLRITAEEEALLMRAAQLQGGLLSAFILASCIERAQRVNLSQWCRKSCGYLQKL